MRTFEPFYTRDTRCARVQTEGERLPMASFFLSRITDLLRHRLRDLLYLIVIAGNVAVCAAGGSGAGQSFSLTTPDRLSDAGWWPTKGESQRSAYVGTAACAQCHAGIAGLQATTPMYHAAARAADAGLLTQHTPLSFHEGLYSYSLRQGEPGASLSVNNGTNSDSQVVQWVFGVGAIGQTYLLEKDGRYTEGRLSYYTKLSSLDITTGQSVEIPSDLEQALGHRLSSDTTMRCFSCHTTGAIIAGSFEPAKAIPGLGCEACHGPGAQHLAAIRAGHAEEASATITNPGALSPSDSVDFCGACHRTAADVALLMPANLGLASLRFQPYRLEKSRCWGAAGDPRVTCIACHDPHQPLVRDLKAYDDKCLACHTTGQQPHGNVTAAACKVSTHQCASCHMPKYEVPHTHATFTDHDIRVVRKGERFPS
jgi:hypothetical protein